MKWRIVSANQLVWHCWEDECLLYNDASGSTHLVGAVMAELLQRLEVAPKTTKQLEMELASVLSSAPLEITEWLGQTLFQLKDLGLITQTSQ